MFAILAAVLLAAAPPQIDVTAQLRAGQSALAARDYAAAKREFSAVLASDSSNPTAHLSLGIIALVQGDAEAGLRHFSAVPGDARALIGKLDCELRLRHVAEARKTAGQLDALTAANPAASTHIGELLAAAGEYATALPFLRRATGAAAANMRGTAEERTGNLSAAVKAFGEAVRLEPASEDYRVDYAATLMNNGDVSSSISAFRAAAESFPKSARIRLGLGSALYLSGEYDAAVTALLEAVRMEPTPRGFDLLGKAFESAGEQKIQIRAEFVKYLANNPHDATAYAHYAAMTNEPAAARQALARALQLDPHLAAAHLRLGIMDQEAGNTEAAAKELQRAAELEPTSAVFYRLSTVYRSLGQKEKAQSALNEYRRLSAKERH